MKFQDIFIIVMNIMVIATFGFIGDKIATDRLHKEFVKTECAQYSPITGKFEIIVP